MKNVLFQEKLKQFLGFEMMKKSSTFLFSYVFIKIIA
jgi:hypothetical protein